MLFKRRRSEAQPVVLPSLDRLSGLIERVVELVDAVGEAKPVPAPEPLAEPPRDAQIAADPPASGWVAFVSSPQGYRLVEGAGALPAAGARVELESAPHVVLRIGRSPLPGDFRRCVYAAGEEPQGADRTSDA